MGVQEDRISRWVADGERFFTKGAKRKAAKGREEVDR